MFGGDAIEWIIFVRRVVEVGEKAIDQIGCVGVFEDDGVDVEEAWHSTSFGCALRRQAD